MPRYFFDVHDGAIMLDDKGHELPNVEAAIRRAVESLPHIVADETRAHREHRHFAIVVRGEDGRAAYTATMTFTGVRLPL